MEKIILPIILIIGLLVATPIFASDIYVDATDGNNSNGGSATAPYKSIVTALSVANDGDTIYIKGNSTYYYHFLETILVAQDNLTITNWGDQYAYFDLLAIMPTFNIQGNNVTLNGLAFQTGEAVSSGVGADSIYITAGYSGTVINNCLFTAGQYAVNLSSNNEDVSITDNAINGDLVGGFMLSEATNTEISGNDITIASNSGTSIYYVLGIENSSNVNILKNKIYNTSSAAVIYLNGNTDTLVANNLIYNNDDISSGVYITGNTNTYVYNNTFYNNYIGVNEDENTNSNLKVKNNIFSNNYYGFDLDSNFTGEYDYNLFDSNVCISMQTNSGGTPSCITTLVDWQDISKQDNNSVSNSAGLSDADNGDMALTSSSYAIDNGTELSAINDDYINVSRPYGDYYDIGAYEYEKDYGPKKTKNLKIIKFTTGNKIKFSWKKIKTAQKYWLKITTLKGKKVYLNKKIKKKSFILKKATNKGLKIGKKYKYKIKIKRVRNGVTYYSPWSKTKKFTFENK